MKVELQFPCTLFNFTEEKPVYKIEDKNQIKIIDFIMPFGGKLSPENRWIKLSKEVPWDKIEEKYSCLFGETGNVAKPCRMALGALLIQEKLKITDEETLNQITENPYLQYFIGLTEYTAKPPFTAPLMVSFRKRFTKEILAEINEDVFIRKNDKDDDNEDPPSNKGTLIVDATCTPSDIAYPTDHDLLNEARGNTEKIIDTLHKTDKGKVLKPRTYRQQARKKYLSIAKKRKNTKKALRKGIKQQLGYIKRNLKTIDKMIEKYGLKVLPNRQNKLLETIKTLYEQQKYMFDNKVHTVDNRIVNLYQPHVRPIVRGKAKASVEFGAKVAVSLVNGYSFVDEISWNNFNEGSELIEVIESYRDKFGYYPVEILADKLYRNTKNIEFCKKNGIRLSGPKLGRPGKNHKEELRQERNDTKARNQVEGKFGEGKRKYGLALIMTKLKETSETVISLKFLIMNFERRLRFLLHFLLYLEIPCFLIHSFAAFAVI